MSVLFIPVVLVYVTIAPKVLHIVSCRSRKHEVEEGVLEMLLSLTDFLAFKQMFLDYKEVLLTHTSLPEIPLTHKQLFSAE